MRNTSISFLVAAGLFGAAGTVHANAFLLNEHDAAAVGRGNAVTATDIDGSSIVYNPGGIAVGNGTRIFVGSAIVFHSESFTNAGDGTKSNSTEGPSPLPELYVLHKFNEMIAAGVGFHTPYGSSITWPASSPSANVIREQALTTLFISAAVGVDLDKLVPGLSVGAVFDVVPASVDLKQDIYFGDPANTGNAHLGGNAMGYGAALGAMYRPPSVPKLSFGAMWHSSVKESFTGNANFTANTPFRSQLPPDGPIQTTIKLSQYAVAGVAVRPTDQLEVELDGQWVNWASFKDLAITLPDGSVTTAVKNYTNTFTVRVGVQYLLMANLALRAGYIYDPTPVPSTTLDATLPDMNRNDLTIGASYYAGNYDVHFGLLYVVPASRTTSDAQGTPPYKGTFDVSGIVPTLSVGGRFGT